MAINQLQRGSTLERKAWMAKVRRMQREFRIRAGVESDSLTALLIWGEGREKRTNKKKGGL